MKYVYHRKPHNLQGNLLYPLNEMEKTLPEIYAQAILKYKGREDVMDERIQLLNCRWNDVVHFAPVHPNIVYKALENAGVLGLRESEWFKIPITKLDERTTVIYSYNDNNGDLSPEQFVYFSSESFNELTAMPQATLDYYNSSVQNKRNPLLFHKTPHILSLKPIDISDCEVICWSNRFI